MTINPDVNGIAHLDWQEYSCQCEHSGGCKNQATHTIARHALHRCNEPGLDPDGNIIELRCAACVMALQTEITCKLVSLAKSMRGARAQCDGCGAPIAELGDVLRSVDEL